MGEIVPVRDELVDLYNGVISIFEALYAEIKELGRKKPEATLSKLKVTHINRVLQDAKLVVQEEPEVKYLDLLDGETLPQYGDAIIVMAQYDGALTAFRGRHHGALPWHDSVDDDDWYLASYDNEEEGDDTEDGEEENGQEEGVEEAEVDSGTR